MALVAGEFKSGGRVVDRFGRDSLKTETAGSALTAGDYKSGGVVRDSDGRIVVVVETLNAAPTAGSVKSGGRLFDDKGRLIVAVSNAALTSGEVLSGGEITDSAGRVVVNNEVLNAAYSAGDINSGGSGRGPFGRRLVAGASSFDPSAFGTLAGWWKADAITGKNDGDAISSWTDSSAAGNNLAQGTGASQPLYKTAIQNGLPVVRFDGVDDSLFKAFALSQPLHVFVVCKYRVAYAADVEVMSGENASNFDTLIRRSATDLSLYGGSGITDTVSTTPEAWHVLSALFSGAASELRVDGGAAGTGNCGTSAAGGIRLAAGGAGPGGFSAIDIGEVIAFSTIVAAGNRATIESNLKTRWGTP